MSGGHIQHTFNIGFPLNVRVLQTSKIQRAIELARMSLDLLAPAGSQLNLLDLPREIRDTIYLAVLQTPSPPPASPEDLGPPSTGDLYEGLKLTTSVSYLNDMRSRYASQSLLACNHQIRAEVHEVLARYDKPGREDWTSSSM